jgi:cytochrome c553
MRREFNRTLLGVIDVQAALSEHVVVFGYGPSRRVSASFFKVTTGVIRMLTRKLIVAIPFALMLAAGVAQAGGDAAKGKELSADCAGCHGEDGKGDADMPGIAGLDPAEHVKMLKGYKSGEIADEMGMMQDYVSGLSDQDMEDLAAYYATLGK